MLAQGVFSFLLIICQLELSKSSNILAFFPSAGRSHFKPFEPFFKALAYRGHNVTVVNSFPSHESIPGYHEIVLERKEVGSLPFAETRKQSRVRNWIYIFDMVIDFNTKVYTQRQYHNLVKSNDTQFDLLFVELYHVDSFFLLAQQFDCPIIGISFQPLISSYSWMLKNPLTFSFIPHLYMPYTDHMNFGQRFLNSAFNLFTWIFHYTVSLPTFNEQGKEIWKVSYSEGVPPVPDFERLSMVFVESHFSAGYVRPNLPNIVEVAGIHIQDPKPLPKDIQEFMDASENGVVLVSLGTLLRPEDVDDLGIRLLKVFSKLPYHVIWKWKANLVSDSSSNIMIREWLPQSDILRHPKCKLFISHSGYHSVLEAINAGVPILGIPFFTDQHHNAAIIEKFGIGSRTSYDTNEKDLEAIIRKILDTDEYHKNSQLQSKIFKDRPMRPIDTAIYWTEYVLRYQGAYHLKSAATRLYWFQYLGLDVILVYIGLLSISVYLMKRIFVKLYSYLSFSQDKNKWQTSDNKLKSS